MSIPKTGKDAEKGCVGCPWYDIAEWRKKLIEEWDIESYIGSFKRAKLQPKIFRKLSDKEWHCRDCGGKGIASKQYAGGGGIQGLQRGTKTRPGLVIETADAKCKDCGKLKKCDRWTGAYAKSTPPAGIDKKSENRILDHYDYTDVIEQRRRQRHELVIDHRFPMERYGGPEKENPADMSDDDIERKYQLLKKDSSGNHNLLKSRACERCKKEGKRQGPLGINFFYKGDENWPAGCPETGAEAEKGCVGCGWYNFDAWRKALNAMLMPENGE